MKLSTLLEAGMSRRNFLKKTGTSTLLPSLIQGGLPANVAKSVTSANPRKIFLSATAQHSSNYMDHSFNPTPDDEFKSISHGFNLIKRLLGKDVEIMSGPTPSNAEFEVGAFVGPEQLASIMNNKRFNDGDVDVYIDNDEEYLIQFGVGDERFKVYMADQDYLGGYLEDISYGDVLKNWWSQWGQRNTEPISDKFFKVLKRHDVDPADRKDSIKREIERKIERNPEEYGDPKKYGIEESQPLEQYKTPDDYGWASSMHQPFESKLARILSVL